MHDMRTGRVIKDKNGKPRVSSAAQRREPVASIAEDVLETFDLVERAATSALQRDASLTAASLTIAKTFTSVRAMQTLDQMNADRMNSSVKLQREPAIARLVVAGETGAMRTYCVCRTSPLSMSGAALTSYRSPVGAMAAEPSTLGLSRASWTTTA